MALQRGHAGLHQFAHQLAGEVEPLEGARAVAQQSHGGQRVPRIGQPGDQQRRLLGAPHAAMQGPPQFGMRQPAERRRDVGFVDHEGGCVGAGEARDARAGGAATHRKIDFGWKDLHHGVALTPRGAARIIARRHASRACRAFHYRGHAPCSTPRRSKTPIRTRRASGSSRSTPCCGCTARSGRITCSSGSSTTRAAPAPTCRSSRTPPTSTRSRRRRSRTTRATARSRSASRPTYAGTRWRWSCRRTGRARSTAATSPATPRRPRCTRSASTISGARPTTAIPGDMVFMQGHSSPGIYARAFLEGRLTEDQLRRFREEVGGGGLSSYPHPWLMPDFWQFPTVSMGLGPMMAIYQARFVRYLEHRGIDPAQRPQGLGVPRRRRDGRAGVARRDHHAGAREARQPGVRRQLQPAAARRPGARQRQDHPGARGRVPRRRLERHQGALGLALGPAAGPRHARPAAPPDDGVRRRRVPELQGQGRRVHARAFLRQVPGAARDGRQHVGRRHLAAQSRRPRSAQGVQRLPRGHGAQGPADGDPRQDGQGLRHGPRGRGPEHHAPAEEAGRRGAQGIPRPLQHPGVGRRHRERAVLPAGGGQRGDPIPARASPGARRLPAAAAHVGAAAAGAGPRCVRAAARVAPASARSPPPWRWCASSASC